MKVYLKRTKTDGVWGQFTHKSESRVWPSDNPNDSPFDTFTCKKCGEQFSLQMYGGSFAGERSFFEKAADILLAHLNYAHSEVDKSELKPGHAKLIGQWREPSFGHLCISLLGNDYAKGYTTMDLMCRCGGKIKSVQEMHDHWQRGHFDVPIYEEI